MNLLSYSHTKNCYRIFSVLWIEMVKFWKRTIANQKWVSGIKIAINTSILIEMMIIGIAVTCCLAFFNCFQWWAYLRSDTHTHTLTHAYNLITHKNPLNKQKSLPYGFDKHTLSLIVHRNLTKKKRNKFCRLLFGRDCFSVRFVSVWFVYRL